MALVRCPRESRVITCQDSTLSKDPPMLTLELNQRNPYALICFYHPLHLRILPIRTQLSQAHTWERG